MKNKINNQCPLCHQSAKLYLDYTKIDKGNYKLWQCQRCQLVYTQPLPDKVALQKFYQSYDSTGQQDGYYRDLKEYRQTAAGRALERLFLRLAKRFNFKKDLPVLDLGSGGGAFLDILKKHDYQAQGVELSQPAVDFAKNNFGVECQVGSATEVDLGTGRFGTIFMWDLLEHLPDQAKIIQQASSWLMPNGYLVIETPNSQALINSFIRGILKIQIKWPAQWMFGLHHLFWHSQSSLTGLLEQHGLTVVKVIKKNTPASRIFPMSLKNFFSWSMLVKLNNAANLLGKQNKLLVIAKK